MRPWSQLETLMLSALRDAPKDAFETARRGHKYGKKGILKRHCQWHEAMLISVESHQGPSRVARPSMGDTESRIQHRWNQFCSKAGKDVNGKSFISSITRVS